MKNESWKKAFLSPEQQEEDDSVFLFVLIPVIIVVLAINPADKAVDQSDVAERDTRETVNTPKSTYEKP